MKATTATRTLRLAREDGAAWLFRIPPPLWRMKDGFIGVPPTAINVTMLMRPLRAQPIRGWAIRRMHRQLTGYAADPASHVFPRLMSRQLSAEREGIDWCRGWYREGSKEYRALLAAAAL